MLAIALRFPAGRFHATPWGRHVNEGAAEWPPSPWRLLRAFVATWKRKLDADPACPRGVVEALLRSVAGPPLFVLPPVATGHSRHYMPLYKGDRTLVFDAFVVVDRRDEVEVLWPEVSLAEPERAALERIAACLGFLGRAESWVEARVLGDGEAADAERRVNAWPAASAAAARDMEPVRLLCVDRTAAFDNERTPKLVKTEGRGAARRRIETALYDPDWHLCLETLELHRQRWSDPPGACWVTYLRRKDCFAVEPRSRPSRRGAAVPTVARFAIDATVLPLVEDTLRIAERARRTLMGTFRRIEEQRLHQGPTPPGEPLPRSDVFSGKDAAGSHLQGHRHALYLPSDEDGDGRIDHLTIVAAMGFGSVEVKALDRLRSLRRDEGDPLSLLLLALGPEGEVSAPWLLGPSAMWISATPFLAPRHAKRNGRKKDPPELLGPDKARAFARQMLLEELARMRELRPEIPVPDMVEPLEEHRCGAHRLRPIQFKRFRQKRGDDGGRRAAGAFRIVFPTPVRGPICLGHSSHFGLGLFVAEEPVGVGYGIRASVVGGSAAAPAATSPHRLFLED